MSNPKYANTGSPLGKLIEECGEVLAAAGKTVRYGPNSTNPELPIEKRETNEKWLKREIADLEEAIDRLKREWGWSPAVDEAGRAGWMMLDQNKRKS